MKLTDRLDEAIAQARQALELGERTGQRDVVAHSLNYLGAALLDLGDLGGAAHLRRSAEVARSAAHYEYTQRAYTNLVEGLYRQGRFRELDHPLAEGLAYAREYGFASHEYNLEAHRCMLMTLRGRWDEAEAGLRRSAGRRGPVSWPASGCRRRPAGCFRKGDPAAGALLARAWRTAARPTRSRRSPWPGSPGWSRPCWPVTTGPRPSRPGPAHCGPGAERYRGERSATWPAAGTRWRCLLGCPPEFALGIQGDCRRGRAGGRSAPPTSTPWSWPLRAASRSCWRRCDARPPGPGRRQPGPQGVARMGRHPSPPPPRPRTWANPGRPHRPPARGPPVARRGPDQRRDRRPPGGVGPHWSTTSPPSWPS